MVVMKLFVLSALACMIGLGASNPQLMQVQSVYILPMGGGMDQFLANRLTRFGKIQVVADPQRADAILTDRLGEVFEKRLDELYPPLIAAITSTREEGSNAESSPPRSRST